MKIQVSYSIHLKLFKETNPQEIEAKLLGDGHVSTRMKHLNMVGNYITQLRGEDAVDWMDKATRSWRF